MMQPPLHTTPRLREALLAHIRVLGLALRTPAAAAVAGLVGLTTLLVIIGAPGQGETIDFRPERYILPALLALVVPIIVWRGQDRFGPGFLWTLPVERQRHALAMVFAGWVWLMGAVALFVFWLLALTLLTGGLVLEEETIRLLSFPAAAPGTVADPSAVRTVGMTPQPLFWLTPFTAATGVYLLASALTLAVRHPLRWIIGAVIGLQLFAIAGDAADVGWPSRLLRALYEGPYGLDALLRARTDSAASWVTLSTGELVHAWRALPHLEEWAMATLIWIGVGLVSLYAAAWRHRDTRRA